MSRVLVALLAAAAFFLLTILNNDVGAVGWRFTIGLVTSVALIASFLCVYSFQSSARRWALLSLLALAIMGLRSQHPWEARLAWCAWLVFIETAFHRADRSFPDGIGAAAALVTILGLGKWLLGAPAILLADGCASLACAVSEQFSEQPMVLGPTATGWPLVFQALVFLSVLSLGTVSRRVRLCCLGFAVLSVGLFLFYPLTLPTLDDTEGAKNMYDGLLWFSALLAGLVGLAFMGRPLRLGTYPPRVLQDSLLMVCGLCLGVVSSGTLPYGDPVESPRVVVLNRGGFDWHRPVYGAFGGFSTGMFGLLPEGMATLGIQCDILDKDVVEKGDLSEADVFVLINCPKIWPEAERAVIASYVEEGGSLLILADHTDVFGLMEGCNSLLPEFGISVAFDSAYHARKSWRGGLEHGPLSVAGSFAHEGIGLAIGASLPVHGLARPVSMAKYAHSDTGVAENVPGAFLGNYHYDVGERLSDLPVVVTSRYGKGRVLVYGDTSTFQNGGFTYNIQSEGNSVLRYLCEPAPFFDHPVVGAALTLLVILMLIFALRRNGAVGIALLLLSCSVSMGLVLTAAQARWGQTLSKQTKAPLALFDSSHSPAIGHYDAGGNTISPLLTCLSRSGFHVRYQKTWDEAALRRARAIAFVAPQRIFSEDEVVQLMAAMERGCTVVLSVGGSESAASEPLLAATQLAIRPIPLGKIPEVEDEEAPRFKDAWPIVSRTPNGPSFADDPDIEIIYSYAGHVTAVFRRIGKGGIVLIADSRFFSSSNVEGLSGFWRGNLKLIHDMFSKFLGGTTDSVVPPFPDPPKTEK